MTYRRDIDGLRAVAVGFVVLFHASVPGFAGGYVGVDVFFVISGYLVTGLLLQSSGNRLLEQLGNFYWRRARRVLPALFLVCATTAIAALYICLPFDLIQIGKFLAATVFMASNLAAWSDQNYFNSSEYFKPLLHLWSIAIEEQFYLTFPIVLLLLRRHYPDRHRQVIAALALMSLGSCWWASYAHPVANYFFPASRAWELLLGAWIALTPALRISKPHLNEVVSAIGLSTLVITALLYSAVTRYPGINTLAPALATGALIVTGRGRQTLASNALSGKFVVGLGLMSYSLYLWHWPALALLGYLTVESPTALQRLALLFGVTVVAAASWRYIELPLRRGTVLRSRRAFASVAAISAAALAISGLGLWHSGGLPQRFSALVTATAQTAFDLHPAAARCVSLPDTQIRAGDLCFFGTNSARAPRVLVWGDSHALVLLPAWERLARERGLSLHLAARSSCRPLLRSATIDSAEWRDGPVCDGFNESMATAVEQIQPDLVILAAFWMAPSGSVSAAAPGANAPLQFQSVLQRTLTRLRSGTRKICFVLDVPALHYNPPYAIAIAERRGISWDFIRVRREEALAADAAIASSVRAYERSGLLQVVDLKDALCPQDRCIVDVDGALLYRDGNHLTRAGAAFVAPILDQCFAALPSKPAT